jgi:hypothetical protein
MRLQRKQKLQSIVLILLIVAIAYANSTGPEARHTGAPGDIGSCVQCHDTFEVANVGPGSVRIDNLPTVYTPGQAYTLRVVVQQAARPRFGFQLTSINMDGDRAGTLTPLGADTQINAVTGTGDRQYIQHTETGTSPTVSGSRTWQVGWVAPSTDIGTVRFYVAGNAANNDGTNQNDYIYTNTALSESATTTVNVSFSSLPDGQTLAAGSRYTIDWSATNTSNVSSYEVRYSTDDGATFPIMNLIFTTTDPNVTSFDWTVPNNPTSQARIRVQAATRSGAAVEIRSGRFSITGDGQPSLPTISSIEIIGKHLYVNGDNFKEGAKVELNSSDIKTNNEEDFSHRLRCKKAGKTIARGQTVSIRVRNPGDIRSDLIFWTRPL